ncbi:hypothetical protein [Aquimarina sediminis]|uniref:hypothetical protein n=1 Tax=Aquimarina sediminis TaxID=2070536 RepID=UPI000CA05297|nr:hypothetical protein [Aquimarina sediminis]
MKLIRLLIFVFFLGLQFSCVSQKTTNDIPVERADQMLGEIYNKYKENQHDYASEPGEARDTILNRFKKTLKTILDNPKFKEHDFEELNKKEKIIVATSSDKKLKIISWDELNGGTWHVYNAMYRYVEGPRMYSGLLSDKKEYLDAYHFKIYDIDTGKYLVKSYGTHGSGKEFYTFRVLSFVDGQIQNCKSCFGGQDYFLLEKNRGDKVSSKYDPIHKTIQYPEYKEDEETGFLNLTGKTITLQYQDGIFHEIE